jgi:hypothetical protein
MMKLVRAPPPIIRQGLAPRRPGYVVAIGPKAKETHVLLHVGAVAGTTSLGGHGCERLGVHILLLTM